MFDQVKHGVFSGTDIDFDRALANISPEKGSNPRQPRLSQKLIGMLNTSEIASNQYIFQNKSRNCSTGPR